jgi:hypothetical protein
MLCAVRFVAFSFCSEKSVNRHLTPPSAAVASPLNPRATPDDASSSRPMNLLAPFRPAPWSSPISFSSAWAEAFRWRAGGDLWARRLEAEGEQGSGIPRAGAADGLRLRASGAVVSQGRRCWGMNNAQPLEVVRQ